MCATQPMVLAVYALGFNLAWLVSTACVIRQLALCMRGVGANFGACGCYLLQWAMACRADKVRARKQSLKTPVADGHLGQQYGCDEWPATFIWK